MLNNQQSLLPDDEPVISLSHLYDAPRALVWEVWTNPDHLKHWWGPDGFTIEHISGDFSVGGHWEFVMIGPDGTRFHNYHQYLEIDPMDQFSHRHGERRDDPDAFISVACFEELAGKTKVTMHMRFPNMAARQEVLGYDADKLGLQTMRNAEDYMADRKLV